MRSVQAAADGDWAAVTGRLVDGRDGGVIDPVTSARIIAMLIRRGYSLLGAYRDPLA